MFWWNAHFLSTFLFWILQELRKQLKKSHDPKVVEELTNHISWIVSDSSLKDNEFVDIYDHATQSIFYFISLILLLCLTINL